MGDDAGITPGEGRESNVAGVGERRALTDQIDGVRTSYGSGKGRFEDLAAADKETRITRCWCAAGDGNKGEELTAMERRSRVLVLVMWTRDARCLAGLWLLRDRTNSCVDY